jgi:cobalt-zinc-cadmium resistance protein CzcA
MIDFIIRFSIRNKLLVGLLVVGIIGWGSYALTRIPLDAVPDITNNQVQIITQSPALATQEMEQMISYPIELAMSNLPGVEEIRSISRFGISLVTVVFDEDMDIYLARQLINEQLDRVKEEIPEGFGTPEMGPISTGLGEVYQYILRPAEGYEERYDLMELRTIHDWVVARRLSGIPGVVEVSGWGGLLKQYEVAVDPERLNSMDLSMTELFTALEANNENTGGSYIEKKYNTYFIRSEGRVRSLDDIKNIVVAQRDGIPVLIGDIAEVAFGSAPRYGAITWNGKGEVVAGQTLMLKGENSYKVVNAVKERVEEIQRILPEGLIIEPFIDRSSLIERAVNTVTENLLFGGLIVIVVLILLLGNFRGGLVVASTIPLSMLFALGMMDVFGVSANLMSLGAIDFGIIVDGAVIIIESVIFYKSAHYTKELIDKKERDEVAIKSASSMMNSAFFGQLIILLVFIPILSLSGIEGKMFRPMAMTVSFAMVGAIVLSLTYVPVMSTWVLSGKSNELNWSNRLMNRIELWFEGILNKSLIYSRSVIIGALIVIAGGSMIYQRLGGEFIPTLDEGDFALHQILPTGSSLNQSIELSTKLQELLIDSIPEIDKIVTKIGSAEIPTDPMPIEVGDIMVKMKPKSEWARSIDREELLDEMDGILQSVPGVGTELSQPIQMRFNELIAGVREDIAIKIFGEDMKILNSKANEVQRLISGIDGIGDLKIEQTVGMTQIVIRFDRNRIARYGLNINDLNRLVRMAYAGERASIVFEGERRFDLVVRLDKDLRKNIEQIEDLYVDLPQGGSVPFGEIASVSLEENPVQITRENTRRRITIGINARGRDTQSLVEEIRSVLDENLKLPYGYFIKYGGSFENLEKALSRLSVAVPVALALIFLLIFIALRSIRETLIIYLSIPMAAVGGILLLWIRDMPFSISAGIGFIVLSGVAVLNGLVLINSIKALKSQGEGTLKDIIVMGTKRRLRPILLTASTDILGFLPMAISGSAGAEVQRPLATVVIGGLITATILTIIVIPSIYYIINSGKMKGIKLGALPLFASLCFSSMAVAQDSIPELSSIEQAVSWAKEHHPDLSEAAYRIEQAEKLRKTAIDFSKTKVQYTYGQIDGPSQDYQWQVNQQFKFPTTYATQSKMQKMEVTQSENKYRLSEIDLEYEVRRAWWNYVFRTEEYALFKDMEGVYSNFSKATRRRYELGEINIVERSSAQNEYRQILLQKQEAQAQLSMEEYVLQQWLAADSIIWISQPRLTRIMPPRMDTNEVESLPLIQVLNTETMLNEQRYKVERAGYLPDLNVGYFNQQLNGIQGFEGVTFGVNIPLFFWAQQGEVQAAKLDWFQSKKRYESDLLKLKAEYKRRLAQLEVYENQIAWYDEEGLEMADQVKRFAEKGYREGEITYLEFINGTRQSLTMRLEYLRILKAYNMAILDLQYLLGEF